MSASNKKSDRDRGLVELAETITRYFAYLMCAVLVVVMAYGSVTIEGSQWSLSDDEKAALGLTFLTLAGFVWERSSIDQVIRSIDVGDRPVHPLLSLISVTCMGIAALLLAVVLVWKNEPFSHTVGVILIVTIAVLALTILITFVQGWRALPKHKRGEVGPPIAALAFVVGSVLQFVAIRPLGF